VAKAHIDFPLSVGIGSAAELGDIVDTRNTDSTSNELEGTYDDEYEGSYALNGPARTLVETQLSHVTSIIVEHVLGLWDVQGAPVGLEETVREYISLMDALTGGAWSAQARLTAEDNARFDAELAA
jgi:hypothetical protein